MTAAGSGAPVLAAAGVEWSAGGRPVLRGVDLAVTRGRVIGVLGPNGSGKSSLLRLLVGLRRPSAGTVRLDGADLHTVPRRRIAQRIAFVEQLAGTDQNPTVRDVIELGRNPYRRPWAGDARRDRAVVDDVAARTDLTARLGDRYSRLSGGEQQRVQIARAFAQEPEVMVLDEPTNHLDVRHQLGLLGMVRDSVAGSRTAAVIALHDLNLAAMFCDEVLLLARGAVIAAGAPAEVITADRIDAVFGVRAAVHRDDGLHVRLYPGGGPALR